MITSDSLEVMKLRRCIENMDLHHQVIEEYNGEDALITLGELADKNNLPNVIFVDFNVSKINITELLDIFNSYEELRKIPLVLLTNCDPHAIMNQEMKSIFKGSISKDLNYSDYLKEIKNIFELSQSDRIRNVS